MHDVAEHQPGSGSQPPEKEPVFTERLLRIYGTGNPVDDNPGEYLGTFTSHMGRLRWHVFVAN